MEITLVETPAEWFGLSLSVSRCFSVKCINSAPKNVIELKENSVKNCILGGIGLDNSKIKENRSRARFC